MSYELLPGEPLGENLRRICCKQIESAISAARGEGEAECTSVHETRKHLKRARAALRLLREAMPKHLYEEQNRALRDAGRLISELRDAEVRLQTVRQLEGRSRRSDRSVGRVEEMLSFELDNFVAAFAGWQTHAIPMLERTVSMFWDSNIDNFDTVCLADAVQSTYEDARKKLTRARADSAAERFHNFRSRVKRLCFQLRIIRPINPLVLKHLSGELAAVGQLLGRAHDLNFVAHRLREGDGKPQWHKETERLLGIAVAGQEELQRDAAELGQHFFSESPRAFGDRLAAWLKRWQQTPAPSPAEEWVECGPKGRSG